MAPRFHTSHIKSPGMMVTGLVCGRCQQSASAPTERGAKELVTGKCTQYFHQARHPSRLAPVGAINTAITAIRADLPRRVFYFFGIPAAPDFQKMSGDCVCHGAQDQAGRTKND